MKPQKSQLWLICISTGYVTYDLFLCFFELGYSFKKGGDFIMHHIVGALGAYAVMVAGRFSVALSAGNLMSEWTTFSMNQRWRMIKHKQGEGTIYMLVNAIFFFSYFFVRIVFMFMLLVRNYQIQQNFDIWSDPPVVAICAIVCTVL